MKKILLTLIIIIGCALGCYAQTYADNSHKYEPTIYQNFNDIIYGNIQSPTHIHFSIYVTKVNINDPIYRYRYDITVVNHSHYYGNGSRIYMSGVRAFVNGTTISNAFPDGFFALINYEQPTSIFWYKVNEGSNLNFSITWANIQHY